MSGESEPVPKRPGDVVRAMTVGPHRRRSHHVQLLSFAIVLVAVITFLVDLAGWFHVGW